MKLDNNVFPVLDMQKDLYPTSANDSALMHIILPLQIVSDININALERSFQTLVNRYDSLRLNFVEKDRQLLQKVQPHFKLNLEIENVDNLVWEKIKDKLYEETKRTFDLQKNILIRVKLFQQKQGSILLFIAHHIILDGWSIQLLFHELRMLYSSYSKNQQADLPAPKKSFRDYVDWYIDRSSKLKMDKLWDYWKGKLSGEIPLLNLRTDYPRKSPRGFRGTCYNFEISVELTKKIIAFAKSKKATNYIVMLTAYYAFLYSYTKQEDIIVATTASNRMHNQFVKTVGYIADSIVLRPYMSQNNTFEELLKSVRDDVFKTLFHREYPFRLLAEKLSVNENPTRPSIHQTSFLFLQSLPEFKEITNLFNPLSSKLIDFGGLKMRRVKDFPVWLVSWREMLFEVIESSDYFFGHCNYNTDLFKESTVMQMVHNYKKVLSIVVEQPELKISEIAGVMS